MTIPINATEQFFHVVVFIMLYNVVVTFMVVDETLVCDDSMRAIEQHFHVVLFVMQYKVVLTFKSLDKTLMYDHSHNSFQAVQLIRTFYYVVQFGSCFFGPY